MWANWNGEILPLEQVRVSVLDRAFLFGDAVYEALRIYNGRLWLCGPHLERLKRSLAELRIPCDADRVHQRMVETLEHSKVREGLMYLQITRGEAARTHYFPKTPPVPNELIYVKEFDGDPHADHRESGVACVTYPDIRWERRDIKSVNLLGNCLASQYAVEQGCFEAILVEPSGHISEGSHTSVFAVKQGKVLTAPKGHHILPGITRGLVLQLAKTASIEVEERAVLKDDLDNIDELFLTGTTTEVLAITKVDGKPVGDGKPGPVTQRLQETYLETLKHWLENTPQVACPGHDI